LDVLAPRLTSPPLAALPTPTQIGKVLINQKNFKPDTWAGGFAETPAKIYSLFKGVPRNRRETI
jgi:hypothetical protein